MSDKLSKQDIATQSGINIGRTKYYMSQFPEYFEEHQVDGKAYPVYEPEAVEVVKLIGDMIRDKDHDEIRTALNDAGFSPIIEYVDKRTVTTDKALTLNNQQLPDMQKSIEAQMSIIDTMARVHKQQADIIGKLESENEDLREERDGLKDENEELKQENEQLKRKLDKRPGIFDRFRGKSSDE